MAVVYDDGEDGRVWAVAVDLDVGARSEGEARARTEEALRGAPFDRFEITAVELVPGQEPPSEGSDR